MIGGGTARRGVRMSSGNGNQAMSSRRPKSMIRTFSKRKKDKLQMRESGQNHL